ncbi:MAG: VCBS repeat-containing protein, partial [Planctomycetales bacterium]|nr:VCBS repeat-containing protein [Planctomycetales bacterium]
RIKVFDVSSGAADKIATFLPFGDAFRGGVSVAVGDVNGDGTADLIAAAGVLGESHVEIYDGETGAMLDAFQLFADNPSSSPLRIAAKDFDGDGTLDNLFAALGSDKEISEVRQTTLDGSLVDTLVEDDDLFFGGYFLG